MNLPKRTTLDLESLEPKHVLEMVRRARDATINKGFLGPFIAHVPGDLDLTQEGDEQGRRLSRLIISIAGITKVSSNYSNTRIVTVAQLEEQTPPTGG